jgi:hypothetical protein
MLGADWREELEQFYVVNSTAKSVRTDLALDLLKQRAESDPELMKVLIDTGQGWKVDGQALTEELAQTDVWRGLIRFPGEEPGVMNRSGGLVNSLKPLLSSSFFGDLTARTRSRSSTPTGGACAGYSPRLSKTRTSTRSKNRPGCM